MKTYSAKAGDIQRGWLLVDAEGQTLGRLASALAHRLRGKHKPTYTPHMDCGDHIVVINAEKVALTGDKETQKTYYRHSGWPGGLRETTAAAVRQKQPQRLLEHAVRGMLPKGPLGRAMFRKLKVYAGSQHPHGAQQPVVFTPPKQKAAAAAQ